MEQHLQNFQKRAAGACAVNIRFFAETNNLHFSRETCRTTLLTNCWLIEARRAF